MNAAPNDAPSPGAMDGAASSGKLAGVDSEHPLIDKALLKEWIAEIHKNNPDALEGWDFDNIDYGQGQQVGKQGMYEQGIKSAAKMTKDWALGTGPKNRIFGPGSLEVENMKDAPGVNGARGLAYAKIKNGIHEPTTIYRAGFGPGKSSGPIAAGMDPTEQFVGSCRVEVVPNADNTELTFIVTNPTSFKSFAYGAAPDWSRNTFGPMGNTYQVYTWTEGVAQ